MRNGQRACGAAAGLALALTVLGTLVPAAWAAPSGPRGFYDSRLAGSAARAAVAAPVTAARAALRSALGPGAVVQADPATGGLRQVVRLGGYLSGPSAADPAAVAWRWVRARRAAFGLTLADLRTLSLSHRFTSPDGITHLQWIHRVGGVPVFDRDLRAHVMRDGRLLSVQGAPLHGPSLGAPAHRLSARAALAAAQRGAGIRAHVPAATAPRGPQHAVRFQDGDSAKLTVFPEAGPDRLGWEVIAADPARQVTYASVVDAGTGQTLWRENLTAEANLANVVDHFPGSPAGGTPHPVDFAPWLFSPATTQVLDGPNAHVYEDVNGNDFLDFGEEVNRSALTLPSQWQFTRGVFQTTPGFSAACAPFGCTWNPTALLGDLPAGGAPGSWTVNSDQFAAQVFYYVNTFHDYLRDAIGFNAAARSFDGNDAMGGRALFGATLAQNGQVPDVQHLNNANMTTPPDGQSPFMRMYLFASPTANDRWRAIFGGDDAGVVYHEYVHGLSGRTIINAAGVQALGPPQAGAMNEAWSDWFAEDYIYTAGFATDGPGADVVMGGYESTVPTGAGPRSQPLDCPANGGGAACPGSGNAGPGGYTYGDMGQLVKDQNGNGVPEVHKDGEIWGETLWDLRAAIGHQAALGVIAGGQRLTPPNPSMLDARNAILQAALAAGGPNLQFAAWKVFAARGMGANARTNGGGDIRPVQDFTLPAAPVTCPGGTVVVGGQKCPPPPKPGVTFKLAGAKLRTALKRGLSVAVTATLAGRATATAAVGAKDAKRLKLKGRRNRSVTVASGSRTVAARRRATVKLTFTKDAKRRLAAAQSVKLTLRISVKTALGGTGSGRTTTLTLRR